MIPGKSIAAVGQLPAQDLLRLMIDLTLVGTDGTPWLPTSSSSILLNKEFATSKTRPDALLPQRSWHAISTLKSVTFLDARRFDGAVLMEAPNDQAVTSLALKLSSLGNERTQILRAFRANEIEDILAKVN
jgi:hypothetical protein